MNQASIIIPTYKRVNLLSQVLESLILQDNIFEILVVDSNTNDGTKKLVESCNLNTEINVKYFDVDNNVSLKRNTGIKESLTENLIFLDDDCIPDKSFVKIHMSHLSANPDILNCGDVFFPEELVLTSNYIRYKNSRHLQYRYKHPNDLDLDFRSIVTMNMSIKKEKVIENNLFFREDFIGYGMEDNEFGCQVMDAGMKLKRCPASIQHMEDNISFMFASKIFHTSRDGVFKLKSINNSAVMKLPYSYFFENDYIHKNFYIKYLIKSFRLLFNIKIAKYVLNILNLIDKNKVLYFPILYRYVFASYYHDGIKKRSEAYKTSKEVSNSWYENNS